MASLPLFHRNRPKVLNRIDDNYCVNCATGLKDCICVPGELGLNPSPVTSSKSETVNLLVNSCVANAHSVTGLPQKKGVNPNYCHNYTEIKYVKDVSCVGHLNSANLVTNAPPVAIDRPVGARLHQFWEKWEALGSSPKVVTALLPVQTQFNQITNCHKQLCQPTKTVPPSGGTVSAGEQKCCRTGSKPKLTRVLQPAIFGTQTQQPVETYLGPEHLEHLPKHRVVQNGDPRDNKNLPTDGEVGHLHRLQGHILPHTNSQSVHEVHAFSHPGSVLSVQSPTLWSVHSTHGVHSGGQRGQTDGFTEGYKNPPVPRRLVGESHIPPYLSPAYTDLGSCLSRTRLTGAKTGFQLRRLPVRLERGQGQTHIRALAGLDRQNSDNPGRSGVSGLAVHVPHRASNSHRKASPTRSTSYETHTVALEEQLEGTRITRKGDTCSQIAPPPPTVVARGKQCASRSTITPTKTCSADIYRRIKRREGHSLKQAHCKGNLVPSRNQVAYKPLGTKGFLALKEFQDLCSNNIVLVTTDNTTVVAYIIKEGGMKLGSLCALLWRILSWCTRKQVTLRARHIPSQLNMIADKLSRLGQTIQTEWSLHLEVFQAICSRWHQPQVDAPPDSTTNCQSLCHRSQTPRHGQWMHSACYGKIWTHMPSHQQPSWAKWWRSYKTTHATESF